MLKNPKEYIIELKQLFGSSLNVHYHGAEGYSGTYLNTRYQPMAGFFKTLDTLSLPIENIQSLITPSQITPSEKTIPIRKTPKYFEIIKSGLLQYGSTFLEKDKSGKYIYMHGYEYETKDKIFNNDLIDLIYSNTT